KGNCGEAKAVFTTETQRPQSGHKAEKAGIKSFLVATLCVVTGSSDAPRPCRRTPAVATGRRRASKKTFPRGAWERGPRSSVRNETGPEGSPGRFGCERGLLLLSRPVEFRRGGRQRLEPGVVADRVEVRVRPQQLPVREPGPQRPGQQ